MANLSIRSAACTSINRMHSAIVNGAVKEWDSVRISIEQRALDNQFARFQTAHDATLVEIKDVNFKEHDEVLAGVQAQYNEASAVLVRRLGELKATSAPTPGDNPSPTVVNPNKVEMKLDPVQIPSFDGSLHKWLAFREAFESLVHQNEELPVAYKLQKLRTAVLPIHVGMVGNIYSGGYEELWQELIERFDNPKLLAETHVSRLMNLEAAKEETGKSLLAIVDRVQETMRALKVMKLPVEHWDALVVPLITSRLPAKTRQAWCMHCKPKEIPTLTSLLSYLQLRAHSLATEINIPGGSKTSASSSTKREKTMQMMRAHVAAANGSQCVFCDQPHRNYACPKFREMDSKQRLKAVRDAGACFNCLKQDHSASSCPSTKSCQKCGKRHNTLLCYNTAPPRMPKRRESEIAVAPVAWQDRPHGPPDESH